MRTTLASLRLTTLFVSSIFVLGSCASSGGGGTGGQGATGTGGGGGNTGTGGGGSTGTGGNSTGGSGPGTGGSIGTGGNGTGGSATGGVTGTGGNATGGVTGTGGNATGGVTGTGGQGGGSGGSAGANGFVPYVCPTGMSSPTSFPAGSTATRIPGAPPMDNFDGSQGNGYTNVEGPVWITNALYVSEFGSASKPPPSRIIKIDANDNVSVAFPSISDTGSNGLAVDSQGHIVSANHGVGGIVTFTLPSGMPETTLIDMFGGKRFNSPNDLTIRNDGSIYFTDPSGNQGNKVQPNDGVYLLPPGATAAMELISTLNGPNGITLSLDQKTLYVGDNGDGIMKYPVNTDGTIGTGAAFDTTDLAHENTDGMAIDCAGDLYVVRVSEHDIIVANPAGTTIGHITGIPGGGQLTNVAFGGTDHKTLYITAMGTLGGTNPSKGVFKLPLSIPGMPY
jgi:gluconolactonase